MEKSALKTAFESIFTVAPTNYFFSPGRINLIGEHTDYNGGHVFPCAITLGTYGAVAPRTDKLVRFYSANFKDLGVIEVSVDDLAYKKEDEWTNYAKGMLYFLQQKGYQIDHGMDVYVDGHIPNGSGLSSSASLELLIGVMAQTVYGLDVDRVDLVKLGMETENKFIGVNSGIMDQFAVGMGKAGSAILLDTNTLDYKLVPLDLKDNVIVIMNTNKRRELADSKYNERRSECEAALADLQTGLKVKALGDLDAKTFDQYNYLIKSPVELKRARHAVWENQRTLRAKNALDAGDLAQFGRLINASHMSLEYDYEVTGKELDTLAHTAWKQAGVLGARMTGAGFGGCGIALVARDKVAAFKENVGKVYEEKIGYAPAFYVAEVADGTKEL